MAIGVKKEGYLKKNICLATAVLLLITCKIFSAPEGLTEEGFAVLCLFSATVFLWLGEVFPMWVSVLFMYFMFPWYGVMTVSECYKNFSGSSCFFILATFAIAAAMSTTSLPGRICSTIVEKFGRNSKMFVLAIMMSTTVLSMMMSTIAVVSIFIALVRPIMKAHCGESKNSNLAKCLYLGLPISCNLGGFMSLSSTPGNIVINDMLETYCGLHVNYFQWLIVGVPVSIIFKILSWLIIIHVFSPEPLNPKVIEQYKDLRKNQIPMERREIKAMVIICGTIICWVLGSWISFLDTTIVAMTSMVLLITPGIEVLTTKQLNDHIQWGTVILLGTISGLVAGITMHNVPDWIVTTVFANMGQMHGVIVIIMGIVFMAVMRNFIPTGTAFVSFMALPMFGLASIVNYNLIAMMFLVSFWSCIICLVPYDPIYFAGYFDGYYSVNDTVKSGIWIMFTFIVLSPIMITLLSLFI